MDNACSYATYTQSSLLSALIGEMRRLEGSVKLYGKTAYCAQQAWIQNATLRDNILFGLPYDEAKYDRVIDACALASDLEILPGKIRILGSKSYYGYNNALSPHRFAAGDLTEIGEQGIGLSGGQKARVNLARAVYNDCDILLLDDILAAVDAHVGTHLFEQCIMGELKNKTRVLVTHRLHVLPSVDHIILMEGGVIIAQGTYEALLKDEPKFTAMVNQMDGENGSDGPQTASTGEKERPKPLAMTSSIVRRKMTVDGVVNDQAKLVTGEERATGKVSWPAYKAYGQMSGGLLHAITVFLLVFVVTQTIRVANDIWLSVWVERSILGWDDLRYELVYASLGVAQAIAFIVSGVNVILGSIAACRQLHEKALASVLKVTVQRRRVCSY